MNSLDSRLRFDCPVGLQSFGQRREKGSLSAHASAFESLPDAFNR